jgi:lipopolysaccharide transport system ATP-binding protein
MQMRIAFAVATAWEPDLLIIDEALAVGDLYFQIKSFNRIKALRQQGMSLVIVSHDHNAILTLCDRCLVLENGSAAYFGQPEQALDFYNAIIAPEISRAQVLPARSQRELAARSGDGRAQIENVAVTDDCGNLIDTVGVGQQIIFRCKITVHANLERLVVGFSVRNKLGQVIYGSNTKLTDQVATELRSGDFIQVEIFFHANLGVGMYSLQLALVDNEHHLDNNYDWVNHAAEFQVVNPTGPRFEGLLFTEATFKLQRSGPSRWDSPAPPI